MAAAFTSKHFSGSLNTPAARELGNPSDGAILGSNKAVTLAQYDA